MATTPNATADRINHLEHIRGTDATAADSFEDDDLMESAGAKADRLLKGLKAAGLSLWSLRFLSHGHPGWTTDKHDKRYNDKLISAARLFIQKGGNGGYNYWRVFEAIYGNAVEVDEWTEEVYLKGRAQPLELPNDLFVELDGLLNLGCPLSNGNKTDYLKKFLRDRRVNRFRQHLKECLKQYPEDLPEWDRMAEILFGTADELSQKMLECWLVAHVKRVEKPGHTFKHMLVLSGRQSIGKSPFFQILARMPEEDSHSSPRYFWTQSAATSEEHAKRQRSRRAIIEAAELEGLTSKSDVETFKNMLSDNNDTWKVNHQEVERVIPRHYVFGGSVNSVNVFKDKTGNERFWLIECGDRRINLEWLEDNIYHIRATAYRKMLEGAITELPADLVTGSEQRNLGYMAGGSIEDAVASIMTNLEEHGAIAIQNPNDIVKALSEDYERVSKSAVLQGLKNLGYESKNTKVGGRSVRVYRKDTEGKVMFCTHAQIATAHKASVASGYSD